MAIQSCFRYPGAKSRWANVIAPYIDSIMVGESAFCDSFVGGGSILLDIATKYPNIHLYINDKDYWMYCFWKFVSGNDKTQLDSLLNLIDTQPTIDLFYQLRAEETKDELRCAYKAIFFNRCAFSGILKSGPIGGKEQKSKYKVDCRYNAKKLKEKILAINKLLVDRTTVDNKDFSDYIPTIDCPIYADPPYVKAGNALYIEGMSEEEHKNLQKALSQKSKWVLSYDDCDLIRNLYKDNNIIELDARYSINGKKTDWASKKELIITK